MKGLLKRVLPARGFQALRSFRHRRIHRVASLVDYTVIAGPFSGMKYPHACVLPYMSSGDVSKKLLGLYELQCVPFIRQALARSYSQIINIGAGEGYYAVGMARLARCNIIAFEANVGNRELCAELARANQVSVDIRGTCTVDELQTCLKDRALIICDCEGAESELLDSERIPLLSTADVIVELHDFIKPGVSPLIYRRFARTHSRQEATDRLLTAEDLPKIPGLSSGLQAMVLASHRVPGMAWAFFRMLSH